MVASTIILNGLSAFALFDLGATHSFVSSRFASKLIRKPISLDSRLCVATPSGVSMFTSSLLDNCVLCFGNKTLRADLIILEFTDFDVILGMDWLSKCGACINCKEKKVRFSPIDGQKFEFIGSKFKPWPKLLTAMQTLKCMRQRCHVYLISFVNKESDTLQPQDIKVVRDFLDVFQEDLSGLPPD